MGVQTALLISAAVSAGATLLQARAANAAARSDIARYEDEKKYAELVALEDENNRNKQMNVTLSNNRVVAGAAGILDDSRSFLTIQQDVIDNAAKDIANIRLNKTIAQTKYDQSIINSKIDMQSVTFGSIATVGSYAMQGWAYYDFYKPATGQTGTIRTAPSGEARGFSGGKFGGGV